MSGTGVKFEFSDVLFFGRGLKEYIDMFDLNVRELVGHKVLDCGAGPASFAAEAAALGIAVVACDPMYNADVATLENCVDRDASRVAEKQSAVPHIFHAALVPTSQRRQDMQVFLNDYTHGKSIGRYQAANLPELPFEDQSFDFVLSANLLFLYSDITNGGMLENSPFDYAFHSRAIKELIRVCKREVRIYPLQGPEVKEHSFLRSIISECDENNCTAVVEPVRERDIIGAEKMLRIKRGSSSPQRRQ